MMKKKATRVGFDWRRKKNLFFSLPSTFKPSNHETHLKSLLWIHLSTAKQPNPLTIFEKSRENLHSPLAFGGKREEKKFSFSWFFFSFFFNFLFISLQFLEFMKPDRLVCVWIFSLLFFHGYGFENPCKTASFFGLSSRNGEVLGGLSVGGFWWGVLGFVIVWIDSWKPISLLHFSSEPMFLNQFMHFLKSIHTFRRRTPLDGSFWSFCFLLFCFQ